MIHGALRDGRRRAANAPSTKFSFICSRPTAWPLRAFTASAAQGAPSTNTGKPNGSRTHETYKTNHRQRPATSNSTAPKDQTDQYLSRLESCLPPHLRSSAYASTDNGSAFVPDAHAMARLALDADKQFFGVLVWLAVDQGRWRAAVWIVKLLVEHFHAESPLSNRLIHTIQKWNWSGSLDDAVESPLYLVPRSGEAATAPHIQTSSAASLHELTDDKPESLSRSEVLRHDILGLVWRDIGRLIIACTTNNDIAGGEVKPDVLEMIALLHHYELMPASIYKYVPAESEDAIQQPPTLHLLSSRIFTALSDATWRAREFSALEEAKRKGGELMGLEAKGSSYRVRVSGVKPEIWLELMLWSCLHGGWIMEGFSLLRYLHQLKEWKPISWRDSLNAIMPVGKKDSLDWDSIKFMFDSRSNATMDGVDITGLRVDKTVSSEVVNAYIDALLNTVSTGVGHRGVSISFITRSIGHLRQFLQKANLNLGGGSWDAMMLRLVESGGVDLDRNPQMVLQMIGLSPGIGEELRSRRSQIIPAYVLDGSAATLGLLHRVLYAEIKENNLEGALKVFKLLQERVDDDRHQSISDFFSNKHLPFAEADTKPTTKGLFTSNFSGIDYPSFSTQIPPTTLAAFLELVTENRYFDLGNWMLGINNTDIDGPLIPLSLYSNPHISASIVHYATATNNTALLAKVTKLGAVQPDEDGNSGPTIPREMLQASFDAQIELKRWDAATKILEYMRDTEDFEWSIANAACVAKAMIIESQSAASSESSGSISSRAEDIFASMLAGRYGDAQLVQTRKAAQLTTLRVVLSAVSPALAAKVRQISNLPKFFHCFFGVSAFNSILEATVAVHGSEAGRALIDKFTSATTEQSQHSERERERPTNDELRRMPRFLRDAIEADSLPRARIRIPGAGKGLHSVRDVAMYGRLRIVGPTTVRIIVRQALRERSELASHQDRAADSLDIFAWSLNTLRRAGHDRSAVWGEVNGESGLTGEEIQRVRERAREMSGAGRRGGEEMKDVEPPVSV